MLKNMFLLVVSLLYLTSGGICYADKVEDNAPHTKDHIVFLSTPTSCTLDDGIIISFSNLVIDTDAGKSAKKGYYSNAGSFFYGSEPIQFEGVGISIQNISDQIKIIHWAESTLVVGDYSGLPFLDGMMFKKAGDATALADTILSPKQSIDKIIYVSTVYKYPGDGKWYFLGPYIPKDNSMIVTLNLKIFDAHGTANYYSIHSPNIGLEGSAIIN